MPDGSVYHFLAILLLYSIQTSSSTNHQVYTSSFDPRDFYFLLVLLFDLFNLFKPVSWFITLNFLTYSTVYCRLYTFILSSFSIRMSLDTFLLFVGILSFDWENGVAVTSWPVLVVAPRLDFTQPLPRESCKGRSRPSPDYSRHTRLKLFSTFVIWGYHWRDHRVVMYHGNNTLSPRLSSLQL